MDNELSEEQKEILIDLVEECAEVICECTKILRFGIDGMRPGTTSSNRSKLTKEVSDVLACIQVVDKAGLFLKGENVFVYYKRLKLAKLGGKYSNLPKEWLE